MKRWLSKTYPTGCSFGFKLLLLAGTMGLLSLTGLLESPSRSVSSDALSMRQADASLKRAPKSSSVMGADVGRVDINRGSADDLRRLPGIGPVLAERVIRHRREHGKFGSIHDIQNVKGIGAKKFARFEPYIHVDDNAPSSGE